MLEVRWWKTEIENVQIIKTTASIPTKFCTVIGRPPSTLRGWSQHTHHKYKMADGRHLEKSKIAISLLWFKQFRQNLTRWCTSALLTAATIKNWKFWKSKMAAAAILKNRIIAIPQLQFEQFWQNLAQEWSLTLLTVPTVKNLKFRKSKMVAAATLKMEQTPCLGCVLSNIDKIWHDDAFQPSWPFRMLNIWKFENPKWRRPPCWKIAISRPQFELFRLNLAQWGSSTFLTVAAVKIYNFATLKNPKIAISRQLFVWSSQHLAWLRTLALRTGQAVEISNF